MKVTRDTFCSHDRWPAHQGRGSHGHVLLLTLFTLMIVITSLSLLARQSARKALRAIDAQDRLQMKWAAYSLEITLQDHAPTLHAMLAKPHLSEMDQLPAPQQSFNLTLGQFQYTVLLGDENAKLNLNHQKLGEIHPDIVMPMIASEEEYKTWTEYWPNASPAFLTGSTNFEDAISARLTPWHSGMLNPSRVNDAILTAHLSKYLSSKKIEKLLRHKQKFMAFRSKSLDQTKSISASKTENEGANVDQENNLLTWQWEDAALDLSHNEKKNLKKRLVSRSNIYSSWIICRRLETPIDRPRYRHSVYEYKVEEVKQGSPPQNGPQASQQINMANEANGSDAPPKTASGKIIKPLPQSTRYKRIKTHRYSW